MISIIQQLKQRVAETPFRYPPRHVLDIERKLRLYYTRLDEVGTHLATFILCILRRSTIVTSSYNWFLRPEKLGFQWGRGGELAPATSKWGAAHPRLSDHAPNARCLSGLVVPGPPEGVKGRRCSLSKLEVTSL